MKIVNEKDGLVVTFLDKMGTDLTVANAARVSFAKKKETFDPGDSKLISFLAEHNHWTPFGHASLQVHVKAPIAIAAQLKKHQVGLVWNEVSRRYVDTPPEIFIPSKWRQRAPNKKQGSLENVFVDDVTPDVVEALEYVFDLYLDMLKRGVAPEQARLVLPQSAITEWYWSGSLAAFARVAKLRIPSDTQYETRLIGSQIAEIMREHFPVSTKSLLGELI